MRLTWHIVALAALACGMTCVLLGICIWAIDRSFAPPSLLLAPISTVLLGGAGVIVAYMRGYTNALMKLPPTPPGTEYRLVPSLSPPPSEAQLLGGEPFPAASAGIPAVAFDLADEPTTLHAPQKPKGRP